MDINKLKSLINLSPIEKVILSFIIFIFLGSILLVLPWSTKNGISFIDALFTSTSAVCVTGLIVLDTAKDFTLFGQIIILTLVQFGGLGIMTFSIALLALIGGEFSIKWRFTFESFYSDINKLPVKSILKRIVVYTIYIELVAAVFFFTQFIRDFDFATALWHAVFHSISSFCNAGFSTFSDSLTRYRGNPVVILTSSTAIILGGLGFIVLMELLKAQFSRQIKTRSQFSLHTRIVLVMTALLITAGTASFLILEWDYVLKDFSLNDKLLTSFFHSVSCRTAGFNTIDIGSLRESTLFSFITLMFIGGSPGSIAGGIKTTTVASIAALIYAKLKGRSQVIFWGRALDFDTVDKSTTLTILAVIFICMSTFFMLAIHSFDIDHTFISGLFEVTSAFNTVGLSTGITSTISNEGKILLSIVMLVGRLGPLTLIMALKARKKDIPIEYAEEHIMIG